MSKTHTSKIRFNIKLNDSSIPEEIEWHASDSQHKESQPTKTLMVNLWDPNEKNTMSIHLWTKEMQVDEMYVHYYQSLMAMADMLQRATGNSFAVEEMKKFCNDFDAKVKKSFEEENQSK